MPSTKVFAAVLAALAMPMVNAGPCKPQPVTTSSTEAVITTTATGITTGGTEAATTTTGAAATTTSDAACAYYTPLSNQPADCGKKGHIYNDEGKNIGSPSTVTNSAECAKKCGMTVGCKSFSTTAAGQCKLYNLPFSELGINSNGPSEISFYDLEGCFGCGEEPTATSGTETATGSATSGTDTTTAAAGTTETSETETQTHANSATTTTAATATSDAACTHYTPLSNQPADCGKQGLLYNDHGKTIGSSSTVANSDECGNKCGMTVGCKSFSVKGNSCVLYSGLVSELGISDSGPADWLLHFYDLEACFGCGEESTATSGTETATTPATDISATSGAPTDTTTAAATGTTTDVASAGTTTEAAGTTTAAATTTTDAACTAYTPVANPPSANCAKKGKAVLPQVIKTQSADDVNQCAAACGSYISDSTPSVTCKSFSYKAGSSTCTLYKAHISEMSVVDCSSSDEAEFYDFDVCYSCQEGGASTTEATGTTTEAAGTTTDAVSAGTTTDAEATGTTTEAAGTTTAAATTTTDAACTAYTPVAQQPETNCGIVGNHGNVDFYDSEQGVVANADACAVKCGSFVGNFECQSFSFKPVTSECTLYSSSTRMLQITESSSPNTPVFYDLAYCYSCGKDSATTTTAAGSTTEAAGTTTEAAGTTTEAAGTTTEAAGTTTEAAGTTTEAAGTTTAAADTTTEAAGTTTEAAGTTTEAAGTTTAAADTTTEAAG
ncbi:hypothetical protein FGRMN_7951, partial [Fusarium graminum]